MSKDEMSIHVLRKVVLDGFLLVIVIVSLILVDSYWTPYQRGFFCGDESIMYPYKSDTVPVYALRLCSYCIPAIAIIFCEFALLRKERSDIRCFGVPIPTWIRGVYCVAISFAFGLCFTELFTNIIKKVVGRPRPCFLAVCQPSVNCSLPEWQNRYIEPFEFFCKGERKDLFKDIRMSFLSGHTSLSAFAMVFLIVYLEKRMTWQVTRTLRHMLQFAAATLSAYIALSRVSDYKHHWSDVLAGYVLGVTLGVLMCARGTDLIMEKKHHLPLPQTEVNMANHLQTILPRQAT